MAILTKPLKLCFWNANGVRRDINILTEFLEHFEIDILLINETHLTTNIRFTIKNYTIYRNDGPRAPYGGTAIAIKSTIHHSHVPTPSFINLEATFITIPVSNTYLQIGAIYCSPSMPLLISDLDLLHSMSNNYINAGDFNAKNISWNSSLTTTRGKLLENHANLHNYNIIAPDEPTHFPYNDKHRPDVLDIATINTTLLPQYIESVPGLTSDHNPVILVLDHIPATTFLKANKFPHIDWQTFRNYLNYSIPENVNICTKEELDSEIKLYISTVKHAIKLATTHYQNQSSISDNEIKMMCKQKRQARKKWQKSRNLTDKTIYNNLKNKLHRKANELKIDKFEADVRDAASSNNIWKISKRLTKSSNNGKQLPIQSSCGLLHNPDEKAEAVANFLEKIFNEPPEDPNYREENQEVFRKVSELMQQPHSNNTQLTTPCEVVKIIKALKSSKSPGPDHITNLVLKNLPKKTIYYLAKIFNMALKLEYFPICWRHAHILTIPKQHKNPIFPENRRPISLLDTHAKLLERIILKRLLPYTASVIPPWQTAFQKGCSINHNIVALVEDVTIGFNLESYTAAIFLDVAKAFDSVWHHGLIYKMHLHFPLSLICMIFNYLENRTFQVKMDGHLSTTHHIKAGVPQGSVLGPILYCLYMSDIPVNTQTKTLMYADDTLVYSTNFNPNTAVSNLQTHIDSLEKWFKKWRVLINSEKCQAIIFSRCRKRPRDNLRINNQEIPYTTCIKYLGTHLDNKLVWHRHVELTKSKGCGRIFLLFPLLKCPVLSFKRKVMLFKMLILPVLTFAVPAWCYIPKSVFKHLQIVQNKALRIIHNSDWYTTKI